MKKGPDRIEPGRDLKLSNAVGGYRIAQRAEVARLAICDP
jgi:hypothetical protein